jgi:hypothetical protein
MDLNCDLCCHLALFSWTIIIFENYTKKRKFPSKLVYRLGSQCGATTFSMTTLSIMIFDIIAFSIMAFSIMALSIIELIVTLSI